MSHGIVLFALVFIVLRFCWLVLVRTFLIWQVVSFACLDLVGGNIIRAAAIVIKYIEWAERV